MGRKGEACSYLVGAILRVHVCKAGGLEHGPVGRHAVEVVPPLHTRESSDVVPHKAPSKQVSSSCSDAAGQSIQGKLCPRV